MTTTTITKMNQHFFERFADIADSEESANFLVNAFDGDTAAAEHFSKYLPEQATAMCDNYTEVAWAIAKIGSDGAFFIYPVSDETYEFTNAETGKTYLVDGKLFGFALCWDAFSYLRYAFISHGGHASYTICNHIYLTMQERFNDLTESMLAEDGLISEEREAIINMSDLVFWCLK
ncbi:MAG: hypothetical protein ACTIJH_06415 [Moraxellaceae bacterium]